MFGGRFQLRDKTTYKWTRGDLLTIGGSLILSLVVTSSLYLVRRGCIGVSFPAAILTFDGLMIAVLTISKTENRLSVIARVSFVISALFTLYSILWSEQITDCGEAIFISANGSINDSLFLALFAMGTGMMLWLVPLLDNEFRVHPVNTKTTEEDSL